MEHIHEWIISALLGIFMAFIAAAMALRRTFVFKDEYEKHRKNCRELMKKNGELMEKDLEMRDQAIQRLEEKIDTTHKELKADICHVKQMVRAILTKLNISESEVDRST